MGNVSGQKGCGRKVGKEGTHVSDMFLFGRLQAGLRDRDVRRRAGVAAAAGYYATTHLL